MSHPSSRKHSHKQKRSPHKGGEARGKKDGEFRGKGGTGGEFRGQRNIERNKGRNPEQNKDQNKERNYEKNTERNKEGAREGNRDVRHGKHRRYKRGENANPARSLLYGTHAVLAALKNPRRHIRTFYCLPQTRDFLSEHDVSLHPSAQEKVLEKNGFDALLGRDAVHQGVALDAAPLTPLTLEALAARADLIVMLDQVTDPHNVGAILRSCAAFGVRGLIVQDRHSPEETGTLAKAASGALELVSIVRVTNLSRTLEYLKEQDFTAYGLDERGASMNTLPAFGRKSVLVFGAEGGGLRQLVAQNCDHLMALPTTPQMPSLNVSNAVAISLYAARKP